MIEPRQPFRGWANREAKRGSAELAAEAERLLAELTDPERFDSGLRSEPTAVPDAASSRRPEALPPGGTSDQTSGQERDQVEALELARVAMAAARRISERVNAVGSKADATSADLIELGWVISEALEATNKRLEALERLPVAESGLAESAPPLAASAPEAWPGEPVVVRLREMLRRFGEA